MKNWIFFLSISAFLAAFTSCEDNDSPATPLPDCIEQKIEEYKSASACALDSAQVTRFNSELGFFYLFSYDYCCCDYTSPILDSDCNEVCFLGGIAFRTKCLVNNMELHLSNPIVVWKK